MLAHPSDSLASLYSDMLSWLLGSDWQVESVDRDAAAHEVYVHVGYCGPGPIYDHTEERRWRHLDTCDYQTFIVCRVPRKVNETGIVRTLPVPWSAPHQRITTVFETQCIDSLVEVRNRRVVARLLRISDEVIDGIYARATARGQSRQREAALDNPPIFAQVGIDEKLYQHPHQMATLVMDLETGVVLAAEQGRSQASGTRALRSALPLEVQRESVEVIALDMYDAFIAAAATELPNASIVIDRFHLEMSLNTAIDQTRRGEVKEQPDILTGNRMWFLRRAEKGSAQRTTILDLAHQHSLRTALAWIAREDFHALYKCRTASKAREFLTQWIADNATSTVKAVKKVAKTFLKYFQGILHYFPNRVTNARTERVNGKIKQMIVNARGFKSFEHFRNALFFYFGNLALYP